ncbi:50S ribosomal protein L17 [Rhodohalobacter sp. 614A]|uniref:50S ribosomal protein L17 n=1 Tax=Rhodohalobacter sp. 614A TaxID=2908649 RepID=UPI00351D60B6
MRHQVKGKKLSRSTPHRKATLQALSVALIKEHRIKTTVAKAKELRTFIEPLITTAKVDNTHNRRKAFSSLQSKEAVTALFETVGPAAKDRPGGYTRVLKLGYRLGDSAEMAVIELVDFNDIKPETKSSKKKRTRRAGKSNKPTSASESSTTTTKSDDADTEETKSKKSAETAEVEAKEQSTSESSEDTSSEEKEDK